jgi:hypothetical protein
MNRRARSMRTRCEHRSTLAGPLVALLFGCASPKGASSTVVSDAGAREPAVHRAVALPCTAPRPPGATNVDPSPGSTCTLDSECSTGTNGRCEGGLAHGANVCTYDECVEDRDCPGGRGVCDCRNTARYDANVCFNDGCRVDSDCGAGGFCSPSLTDLDKRSCGALTSGDWGFFCHMPADRCVDDSDCNSAGQRCAHYRGSWICVAPQCLG